MDPKEILLVEDEPDIADLLVHVLEDAGYHVRHAPDGQEAIALLGRFSVDLVVSDALMPRMDGLEMLARMRRSSALREIPVLIVSALDEEDLRCRSSSVFSYLQKPFKVRQLLDQVRALMTIPA
jgi:DNA-binding response OmpR family regulator